MVSFFKRDILVVSNQLTSFIAPIIIGLFVFVCFYFFFGKDKINEYINRLKRNQHSILVVILAFFTAGEFFTGLFDVYTHGDTSITDLIIIAFISVTSFYILGIEIFFEPNKDIIKEFLIERRVIMPNTKVLLEHHNCISKKGIIDYRDSITNEFISSLKELCTKDRTLPLTIREGHVWSVDLLDSLQAGDSVKAVSLLGYNLGEWNKECTPSWDDYNAATIKAAERCKDVRRIFITDKNQLSEFVKLKIDTSDPTKKEPVCPDVKTLVDEHVPPKYEKVGNKYRLTESPKMTGIFVDREECYKNFTLKENHLKQGFILINKGGVRMAVIDDFTDQTPGRKYKVIITYNEDELNKLEEAFKSITENDDIGNYFISSIKILNAKQIIEIPINGDLYDWTNL